MSKLAERIYDRWFGKGKAVKRHYAAARVNRQNAGWSTSPTGANYERRISLAILRARARQASRDDPHLSKFLALSRSNIIGPKGIQLQSRANGLDGKLDIELNKMVEEAWWQWGHAETCTLSGKMNWKALQDLIVTQLKCDGEFLVQMVSADNPFGFALKVWDVNWLDEVYNEVLPNGNRIIMSVEIDANNKPVAYWLTTPMTEINFTARRARQRTRVSADEMIHGFLVYDDESQVRGVSSMAAVLLTAKNFQAYKEGVIQSARWSSNQVAFLSQKVPDGEGSYEGKEDAEGNVTLPVIDSAPGSINTLPPNWGLETLDPKQPTQNHAAFAKTILMEMAAGLGIPYFYLAGDMEAVNFSSSRVGLDDARDIWKGLQEFVATTLCRPVFNKWVLQAFLNKQLKISAKQFNEIQNPLWRPRRWPYIDPTKDTTATIDRLKNGLTDPLTVFAELGEDYGEHLARWKVAREMAAAVGINIDEMYAEQPKQLGPAPADDPNADETPPEKPKRGLLNGLDHEEMVN